MKVIVKGGSPATPIKVTIPKGSDLSKEFPKFLETLSHDIPGLGFCQVGTGKTFGTVHGAIPWAVERRLKIFYISSRVANNDQTKTEIIKVLGMDHLTKELTPEGIRAKEDFGVIFITTYHKAYYYMINTPEMLKDFDIAIVDEIQAVLEDATFVGFTGEFLKKLPVVFGHARRLYLSATPDDVLPLLTEAEAPYTIHILHMPRDYSFVKPHFFSKKELLLKEINQDKSDKKWLVFIPSIKAGQKFASGLKCSYCMLNGEVRECDPDTWRKVVSSKKFKEKVLIITRVCDTGFGLKDSQLINVAVFSISPTTLIQVLGRKRREDQDETVNLYVYCPSVDEMKRRLASNIEKQEALCSFWEHRAMFLNQYILQPKELDFRLLMNVHKDGSMEPNYLALEYYKNEAAVMNKFLKKVKELKDPCCFDRLVCRWFGISVPPRAESWLNPEISGYGKENFYAFMNDHCNIVMDEKEFDAFMREFPHKCIEAFGKGCNDRLDRKWGAQKFSNKIDELGLPYSLIEDKLNKTYRIIEFVSEAEGGDNQ